VTVATGARVVVLAPGAKVIGVPVVVVPLTVKLGVKVTVALPRLVKVTVAL
jgi:hypothetical protein